MNRVCSGGRWIRWVALCLCGAVYFIVLGLIFQGVENQRQSSRSVAGPVTLSFVQMELQAPSAPPPKPKPELKPDVPLEPEEADVALEKVEKVPEPPSEPEPEPRPESKAPVARVTQQAAAPVRSVSPNDVQDWVVELIEREKYYPAAAERFGLQGTFNLAVTVDESGTIQSAGILEGRGHRVLRQALEKMLSKLPGQCFGQSIGEAVTFEIEFSFE